MKKPAPNSKLGIAIAAVAKAKATAVRAAAYEDGLRAIAQKGCLKNAEPFNRGMTCRENVPLAYSIEEGLVEPDAIFDNQSPHSWCVVCIAEGTLEAVAKAEKAAKKK